MFKQIWHQTSHVIHFYVQAINGIFEIIQKEKSLLFMYTVLYSSYVLQTL